MLPSLGCIHRLSSTTLASVSSMTYIFGQYLELGIVLIWVQSLNCCSGPLKSLTETFRRLRFGCVPLQSLNCLLWSTPTLYRAFYDPLIWMCPFTEPKILLLSTQTLYSKFHDPPVLICPFTEWLTSQWKLITVGINLTLGKVFREKGHDLSVKTVSQHL